MRYQWIVVYQRSGVRLGYHTSGALYALHAEGSLATHVEDAFTGTRYTLADWCAGYARGMYRD